MDYNSILNKHLLQFSNLESLFPGPISDSIHLKSKLNGPHYVFSGLIHGNEVGSLPSFIKIIQQIQNKKIKFHGEVTFILGNKKAALSKERFTEQDLNRAFSHFDDKTHESQRAWEIAQVIKAADLHIDFHQTIEPTRGPFYLFSDTEFNIQLASELAAAKVAIVRDSSQGLSYGQMTCGEFAEANNVPSITIELSQKGFNKESDSICFSALQKIFKLFTQKIEFKSSSTKNTSVQLLRKSKKQKMTHPRMYLIEGLVNLDPVKKGTLLGYDENNRPFTATEDGYLLFPKYPKRVNGEAQGTLPSDIVVIAY